MVDKYNTDSLVSMLSGAAPLDGTTAKAVADRLGCEVGQGYGMTELSPVSHLSPFGAQIYPHSSIGPAIPNVETKLVDPASGEDIDVPSDEESPAGEMWVRGPMVMKGYLNSPQATETTIVDDGWLRTGDIVTYHPGGWFTVVDRLKELIKYKGFQVAPAELEALLLEHEKIADAAVIGVPADDGNEIPKAFIVPQADAEGVTAQLSAEEVIEYVASRVAHFKKVREVEFIDEVPKSRTGKILRRELKPSA